MRNYWSSFVFVWFLHMYLAYLCSGNVTGINAQINWCVEPSFIEDGQ